MECGYGGAVDSSVCTRKLELRTYIALHCVLALSASLLLPSLRLTAVCKVRPIWTWTSVPRVRPAVRLPSMPPEKGTSGGRLHEKAIARTRCQRGNGGQQWSAVASSALGATGFSAGAEYQTQRWP